MGFVRTHSNTNLAAFLLDTQGPLLDTCLFPLFNHKAMVAAVTVILTIVHIALCCSQAT